MSNVSGKSRMPAEHNRNALIFDWDGTLVDSIPRIVDAFQRAFPEASLAPPPEAAIRDVIGMGLPEAVTALAPEVPPDRRAAVQAAYARWYLECSRVSMAPFAGVRRLLECVRDQGFWVGVATGKARRGTERALDDSGLRELIDGVRCSDETASKPDPAMLNELLAESGAEPRQAWMIGDSELDMMMAWRANIAAIGVGSGAHPCQRLLRAGAVTCLDDVTELAGWLEAQAEPAGATDRRLARAVDG